MLCVTSFKIKGEFARDPYNKTMFIELTEKTGFLFKLKFLCAWEGSWDHHPPLNLEMNCAHVALGRVHYKYIGMPTTVWNGTAAKYNTLTYQTHFVFNAVFCLFVLPPLIFHKYWVYVLKTYINLKVLFVVKTDKGFVCYINNL